jgi:hypothetical protein
MLSAICLDTGADEGYGSEGRVAVLGALKAKHEETHKGEFELVAAELRAAVQGNTSPGVYHKAVVGFVNSILISEDDLDPRLELENLFKEAGVMDLIVRVAAFTFIATTSLCPAVPTPPPNPHARAHTHPPTHTHTHTPPHTHTHTNKHKT